jgi:tRNA (guanine-N7-)-methyltransferase
MTAAQKKALENLWPIYGLDPAEPFKPEIAYGRIAPLIVEIGFGNGSSLAEAAANNPQHNFLGIEVHEPGIGHLMNILAHREIPNVRIFQGDAVEILRDRLEDGSVDRINLFFPDPWPKKRHHKRRLVSPAFADLVSRKLKSGGCFHAATDWEDYAFHITETFKTCDKLYLVDTRSTWKLASERSETRFEQRGISLGHKVRDLVFLKRVWLP